MPAISIIVPYYNDPIEYLVKCLDSIVNQTFNDIEIIVVNDGSTERNTVKLESACQKDNRIRVIKQNNSGVSAARNRAIQEAVGDYIAFVDADDIILSDYLDVIYKIAQSRAADIVYTYAYHVLNEIDKQETIEAIESFQADDEWLKKYTVGSLYKKEDDIIFGRGPWARLIRSELVKETPFPIGVPIGEDVLWNLEIIKKATNKVMIPSAWYEYMIRSSSVTQKYDNNICERLQPFYHEIRQYVNDGFLKREHYYNRVFRDLKRYLFKSCYGNQANHDGFFEKWKEFNRMLHNHPWVELMGKECWNIQNAKGKAKIFGLKTKMIYPLWCLLSAIKPS